MAGGGILADRWVIRREKQEDEILELHADGSGALTRSGQVLRGRWLEETRGSMCSVRFSVQQGVASGEYYMGRLDETRTALTKGVIGRGVGRIVGRFAASAVQAPPPLPLLERLPVSLPPPLVGLPKSVLYVPDFLSSADEATLLEHVRLAPAERWTGGSGRRTQNYGGSPGDADVEERLPPWLQALVDALVRTGAWPAEAPPNHVLINEFSPGAGLTPHTDGPLYSPRVATLSLGSDVLLDLHEPPARPGAVPHLHSQLLLRARSLNVMAADAYSRVWHGITSAPSHEITSLVANRQPGDELGHVVERAYRVSIVFVHKLPRVLRAEASPPPACSGPTTTSPSGTFLQACAWRAADARGEKLLGA